MTQQLHLFPATEPSKDTAFDPLLEQTRQLFQHEGSNAELMTQVMRAIEALSEIYEQPKP